MRSTRHDGRLARAVTGPLCLPQLTFDALQNIGQLRRMIRLRDELDVRRHFISTWLSLTRADHNDCRRPAMPDVMGQCQSIHRSRHLDVGKNDPDIGSALQHANGFRGRPCLDAFETRFFQTVDNVHSNDQIVLNHQYRYGSSQCRAPRPIRGTAEGRDRCVKSVLAL